MAVVTKRRFTRGRIVLLAILLVGLAYGLFGSRSHQTKTLNSYAPVATATIEEVVTAQGKLQPKEYVDVGAQVSGQLKKLHVALGDTVKKGKLLAEIDPLVYQAKVEESKAQLKSLQAQLAQAQAQYVLAQQIHQRNVRLIKAQAVSKEALEQSASTDKAAAATVASFKAQIEESASTLKGNETNLSYTKIYAPMDGTVVTNPTREGQTVNANQSAPVIVQLANLDVMTVWAQVAEADVSRLSIGMPVSFTTLGSLEHRWHGTLRQILPSPEVINDVVLYDALVDVDNIKRDLMSGMSTQMYFERGKAENVPTVPVSALGKRVPKEDTSAGQAYQIGVKTDKGSMDKIIHVGLMDRINAEVKDGLEPSDQVTIPTAPAKSTSSGQSRTAGPNMGPRL